MRIYFARHGESHANLLHEISNRGLRHGLTPRGREQADALAGRLREQRITHIYSSPLLRAIETAIIVAHRLGLDYQVVDALREFDCGIAEGRSDPESWRLWHELFNAWLVEGRRELRIEGGESWYDVRERFVPFVGGLVERYRSSEERIFCVSHGGTCCAMLPEVLMNVKPQQVIDRGFPYAGYLVAEPRPAGLYCMEWNGQSIDVRP